MGGLFVIFYLQSTLYSSAETDSSIPSSLSDIAQLPFFIVTNILDKCARFSMTSETISFTGIQSFGSNHFISMLRTSRSLPYHRREYHGLSFPSNLSSLLLLLCLEYLILWCRTKWTWYQHNDVNLLMGVYLFSSDKESETNQLELGSRAAKHPRVKFNKECMFLAACAAGDKDEVNDG